MKLDPGADLKLDNSRDLQRSKVGEKLHRQPGMFFQKNKYKIFITKQQGTLSCCSNSPVCLVEDMER